MEKMWPRPARRPHASDWEGLARLSWRALAHREAAFSRAIAVVSTVLRFLFAARPRCRTHKRLCTFRPRYPFPGELAHAEVHRRCELAIAGRLLRLLGPSFRPGTGIAPDWKLVGQ